MIILLQWSSLWHPEIIVFELLFVWLYAFANARVDKHMAKPATRRQWAFFLAFLLVSYIAFGSPMDAMAQIQSFPMFVTQSMLMTLVMPWMLLIAIPNWMTSSIFGVSWVFRVVKILTHPLVAIVLYSVVTSIFLAPAIFEANLTYNWLHIVDTSVLMSAGLFLWWPLVSMASELPRLERSSQLVYMLFSANLTMPIPFFLIASQHIWYKSYLNANRFHIIADQHLGGTLFLVGTIAVYGIRALITLTNDTRPALH